MSAKTPPVAPKPRPKPRTSVKSPSEDKEKPQSSVAEGNGVATHMQPSDDPVPRPRPRVGTQLPGMADGGYLKPTSRPRVATNPISVTRDPSPTQHRRTTSDAKNDKEEPIYDTPWGKRLHPSGPPPVARKPASPSLGVPPGREKGGSNDTTPATQTQQSARSITPTRPPTRPPPFQAPSQRVSSPLPSPTPPPTVGGGRPKSISSNSGDEETPLSPKRQAPPPPASMGVNTTASSGSKPLERVKSPDRTQAPSRGGLSSSYQKKNDEKPSAEKVAEDMDFFSIELLKVASSAMIGVSMKVRSLHTKPDIKQEISAPFVAKVLPMGAVDKDGRIQVGDAIVEVNGRSLLQTTQEEATQGINETPGKSVRLKVGRPQGSISTMRAPQPAVPPDTSKITLEENSVEGSSDQESDSSLSRIEKLVAEKQCLEEERNEARSELERLRGQMQNVISENERTAAETISKAEEVQNKLNKELTDLQDQMKEIMKQREEQDSMLNKLEEKSGEVEALTSENSKLQSLLKEEQKKGESLQNRVDSLLQQAAQDSKSTDIQPEVVSDLQLQVQKLKSDLTSRETQLEEKDKKIAELKKGLSGVLPELQEAERGIAAYKTTVKEKETVISDLEDKMREKNSTIEELEEQVKQLKESTQEKGKEDGDEVKTSKYSPRKPKDKIVIDLESQVEQLQAELEEANWRASEAERKLEDQMATDVNITTEQSSATLDDSKSSEAKSEDFEVVDSEPDGKEGQDELEASHESQGVVEPRGSPLPKPRIITTKPDHDDHPATEGVKLPPKPMPRPRKKPDTPSGEQPKTERPKSQLEMSGKSELDVSLERRCGSMSQVLDSEWVMVGREEREPTPNFDDFDCLSNLAVGVKTEAGKDKARIGRRPRKSPSREHLKKMSTGGIGEELQPVRLTVVPEDQVPPQVQTRHSRNLSGSQNMGGPHTGGPPLILPKPRGMMRARSAENLVDNDTEDVPIPPTHPQPQRIPMGARVMVPIFPHPLKKTQSDNTLDVDDVKLSVEDQPDGRISGGSSPAKSRPGSAKGQSVEVNASMDSLDKLDRDNLGLSLLTVPDWSVDLVVQWMESAGLGKFNQSLRERGLTGKQLLECDSGKVKGLDMSKDDVGILKKEVKNLKKLHEKAKKDDKKRIDAEKKEAKKKKK